MIAQPSEGNKTGEGTAVMSHELRSGSQEDLIHFKHSKY